MNKYAKEYIESFCKVADEGSGIGMLGGMWNDFKQNVRHPIDRVYAPMAKSLWGGIKDFGKGVYHGVEDPIANMEDNLVDKWHDFDGTNGALKAKDLDATIALLHKRQGIMNQAKNLGYGSDKEYFKALQSGNNPGEVKRVAPVSLPSQHADAHPGMLHSVAIDRARDNVAREAQMNEQLKAESNPKAVLYKGTAPGTTYASQDGKGSVTFLPPGGGKLPQVPNEKGPYKPVFAGDPSANSPLRPNTAPHTGSSMMDGVVSTLANPNEYDPSRAQAPALSAEQRLFNTNKKLI